MKTAGDYTPQRAALNTALAALDTLWQSREPGAHYAAELIWAVKTVQQAWTAARDAGALNGLELPGLSPQLSQTIIMGGLLAITTVAMECGRIRTVAAETGEGAGHD